MSNPPPHSPPRATLTAALNRIRQAWRDIEGFATCCTGPDIRPHVRIDYPDLLTAQNAYRALIEIGAALQSVEPTPAPLISDPLPADATLVDEAWLRAVGFVADFDELEIKHWHEDAYFMASLVYSNRTGWRVGGGTKAHTSLTSIMPPKTRGDLRLLCRALKIDLAEPDLTPTT